MCQLDWLKRDAQGADKTLFLAVSTRGVLEEIRTGFSRWHHPKLWGPEWNNKAKKGRTSSLFLSLEDHRLLPLDIGASCP